MNPEDAPPDRQRHERLDRVERLLAALAARGQVALRLTTPGLDRLLSSIVEAAVTLFDAEAASIALVEPDGTLRFRVAAGARGSGVVGIVVAPGEGIAGFVVATGQPLAISDVASDPRFDRDAAARTGYVPRSLLAVPLQAEDHVLGVLEVLDRRGDGGFDLRDLTVAGVFARQAATAIEVSRTDRDLSRLVADGIAAAIGRSAAPDVNDPLDDDVERAAAQAVAGLESEVGGDFWTAVDRLARLRAADPDRAGLVVDLLEVALRHLDGEPAAGARPGTRGGQAANASRLARQGARAWRDRAGLDEA